jgi:hypothetical protein
MTGQWQAKAMPEDRHIGTAHRKWFRTALFRRVAEATRAAPTLRAGKVERIHVSKKESRRPEDPAAPSV